jgi:hypothetical protein
MRRLVLHPFLLAVFPATFLYAQNRGQLQPQVIVFPVLFTLLLAAALWVSLYRFLKDCLKAGFFVSFLLVWFFSYGHLCSLLNGWTVAGTVIGRERYLLPAWGLVLIAGVYLISRIKNRTAQGMSSFLNVFSALAVLMSLATIGADLLPGGPAPNPAPAHAPDPTPGMPGRKLPDVYYIILDSYGNNATLKESFHFDNREFSGYLSRKGFYTAASARSNYPSTLLSLSSSLNMNYIDRIAGTGARSSYDRILGEKITNNAVSNLFRAKGYRIITIGTGWELAARREGDGTSLREGFNCLLLQTTLLHVFRENLLEEKVRRNILLAFQELTDSIEVGGPKFVFAHIICPHPPFVFGPDGEAVRPLDKIPGLPNLTGTRKRLYADQVIFTNRQMEKILDRILGASAEPPIILLQSDHGCAYVLSPDVMDSRKPASANVPDGRFLSGQTGILSAFYVPEECRRRLYDSITPVNSFRVLFSSCYHQEFPLLEDRVYYSTHKDPYDLVDVTSILKPPFEKGGRGDLSRAKEP